MLIDVRHEKLCFVEQGDNENQRLSLQGTEDKEGAHFQDMKIPC